jgi:hypothetical protein
MLAACHAPACDRHNKARRHPEPWAAPVWKAPTTASHACGEPSCSPSSEGFFLSTPTEQGGHGHWKARMRRRVRLAGKQRALKVPPGCICTLIMQVDIFGSWVGLGGCVVRKRCIFFFWRYQSLSTYLSVLGTRGGRTSFQTLGLEAGPFKDLQGLVQKRY